MWQVWIGRKVVVWRGQRLYGSVMAGVKFPSRQRFSLEPDAVADYREQLRAMAAGIPIAEAGIEGFSDWQVVMAIERLWALGGLGQEPCAAEASALSSSGFSEPHVAGTIDGAVDCAS